MSLLYQGIFVVMCFELVLYVLISLPLPLFIRKQIVLVYLFTFSSYSKTFMQIHFGLIVVVGIFFAEAFRQLAQGNHEKLLESSHYHEDHHDDKERTQMKIFFAQRNIYMTGITLFVSYALNRQISVLAELNEKDDIIANQKKSLDSDKKKN